MAMPDIPSPGVLLLAIWGAHELTRGWRYQVLVLSVAGGAAIVFCLALTRRKNLDVVLATKAHSSPPPGAATNP